MNVFRVITLFPEAFPGPLGVGLVAKAHTKGLWKLEILDMNSVRQECEIDSSIYGGGSGMLLRADAVEKMFKKVSGKTKRIFLSPRGKKIDQKVITDLINEKDITILCGRYEGVDQRVIDKMEIEEYSLGDFILTGGEAAAICLIEACTRLIPKVLGNPKSLEQESFEKDLLECDHYTRPQKWHNISVPDVLLSGNHGMIESWRKENAEKKTKKTRHDLWIKYVERI